MSDDQLTNRIRAAREKLASLRPRVEAGGPWPLAERFGTEPEARWGPPEVLAHVAEMLPYWRGQAERVLAGGEEPVPFGRVADDPVRLAIIERDRTVPSSELFGRIDLDLARWLARLAELGPEERARRGSHPRLGEMRVGGIVERFVAGHLEEHVEQLEAALERPIAGGGAGGSF